MDVSAQHCNLQSTSVAEDLLHLRSDDRRVTQINLRDALAILQGTLSNNDLFHPSSPGTATRCMQFLHFLQHTKWVSSRIHIMRAKLVIPI